MITVKAPQTYLNEPNLLTHSGPRIAGYGEHAIIIAGPTALEQVKEQFLPALRNAGVHYEIQHFTGHCTIDEINQYTEIVIASEAEVVIAIGGGKVLDLSKAVAEKSQLPIVTIPTIAATCAAWSALTVLYDDEGQGAGYLLLHQSPNLILADTTVLAAAPKRYLAAGIGDTLVKWHEFAVNLNGNAQSLALRSSVSTAKLALTILEEHALDVYQAKGSEQDTRAFIEVTDAIIALAGLVGSIQDGSAHATIAHGLHDSLTRLPQTHNSLHGEKVAFGLLTQWVLEGKEGKELHRLASWLHQLDLPVTLAELGIDGDAEEAANLIAKGLKLREGADQHLAFAVHTEQVAADQLGQQLHASTATELPANHPNQNYQPVST